MTRRHRAVPGLVGVAAAVTVAVAASACSSTPANTGPQGHVTLQLWTFPGSEDVLPPVISAFNKKYSPAITVQVTNIPESTYPTKLDLAISAHSGPDLAFPANALDLPAGRFLPLDSYFKNAGLNLASFNQGPINNECKWNGHVYCIGNYLGADVMFYNKALFTKAGVGFPPSNQPLTVDQYVADVCKIYKATGTWGAASGDPFTWLARDNYVTPNGQYVHFTTPSLIDVYTKLQWMYKNKCAPSLSNFDPWNQGADVFSQGKIAMAITDFRGINKIEKAGINYGVAPVPVPAGAHPEVYTWTDNLGIVQTSAHPAQAFTFLKFLATTGQNIAVSVAGDFPLNPQVAAQTHWADDPGRREFLQVQKLVHPEVYIPDIWNISGPVFDAFSKVLNGTSPRAALQDAQQPYQTALDQAWQTFMRGTGGRNPNQGITYGS
jgi:ABC-type glycerol-3-phosphate transport system substrate-binding protein